MTQHTDNRRRAGHQKEASGLIVYLMEELGDARLRATQLKKYVKSAMDLIEKSSHRDHFFEVAAHLIHGIPQTVFKLDKALDAAALAAARLDYEEIKQGLKPEKVEELEGALQDVRMRYLNRRGGLTPEQAYPVNGQRQASVTDKLRAVLDTEIDLVGGNPKAQVTPEIRQAAQAYDAAVEKALQRWTKPRPELFAYGVGPLHSAKTTDDVVRVMVTELRAGFLYFSEAEGSGVGTWEGDWDILFVSDSQKHLTELSDFVERVTRVQFKALRTAVRNEALGE